MSYWWSRSFGLCRLPPGRLAVTWVEAAFTVASVTVVSITVLLATATFSTTIVFSLIAALITASIAAFSDRGSSSVGSDTLIPITGILTIHTILTAGISHILVARMRFSENQCRASASCGSLTPLAL